MPMFTDLEKIVVNFPDIQFEQNLQSLSGYSAVVPNVYQVGVKKGFDKCAHKVSSCIEEMGLKNRPAFILKSLSSSGSSKENCALNLLDRIRNQNIKRHSVHSSANFLPDEDEVYFPVFHDDPFHRHGDPDFIDLAKVFYKQQRQFMTLINQDPLVEMLKILGGNSSIADYEDKVVMFEVNYGRKHSHLINAEVLANRLNL